MTYILRAHALAWVLALFFMAGTSAQELPFTHFTTENQAMPLPLANVQRIRQDRLGYLWIDFYGSVLARYDGHTLEKYTPEDGVPEFTVREIVEASDGRLWIGSDSGLAVSDRPLRAYAPGERVRFVSRVGGVDLVQTGAQARDDTFVVGTAKAARGQKVAGSIEVPAGSDAGLSISVVVAHGAHPGPVLAVVSGAHGTEYASIIALERVIARLNPAELSGTVIVVPLVNVPSFEQKVAHVNPVDGKSMNRFYPGRIDGTQTERASYLITKEVVERADHLIDLHGGDLDESLRPYSYWTVTGRAEQDAISRQMVLAFGIDHIIISMDRPKDPAASRYLENTATTRGKPSITVEAGHAGTTETDDVELLANGCFNVMRYLKMLPGTVTPIQNPVWVESIQTVTSDQTGIFYPLVRRGTYVTQGMKIGYVTDYTGRTLLEARAPASGIILFIRAVPSMTKGETIANIGVVAKQPPN